MYREDVEKLVALLAHVEELDNESTVFKVTRPKTCKIEIDFSGDEELRCHEGIVDHFMSALVFKLSSVTTGEFKVKAMEYVEQKIVTECQTLQADSQSDVDFAKDMIKEYK